MTHSQQLDKMPPGAKLVGRKVLEVDSATGVVRLAFLARPEFANRHGTVSGGFLAAMLDSATAAPILAFLAEDQTVVTTDLHVSFKRPAPLGELFGTGRVVEQDDREIHSEGELSDPEGKRRGASDGDVPHGATPLNARMLEERVEAEVQARSNFFEAVS